MKIGDYKYEIEVERLARDTLWGNYFYKIKLYQVKEPRTPIGGDPYPQFVTSEDGFAYTRAGALKKAKRKVNKLEKKYRTNKYGTVFEAGGTYSMVKEALSK